MDRKLYGTLKNGSLGKGTPSLEKRMATCAEPPLYTRHLLDTSQHNITQEMLSPIVQMRKLRQAQIKLFAKVK